MNESNDYQEKDQFVAAEEILRKMQESLHNIKEKKARQGELADEIQSLSMRLAETQAEEVSLSKELANQNIEWQQLTQRFNSIGKFNID